jgi:hypothetical protein
MRAGGGPHETFVEDLDEEEGDTEEEDDDDDYNGEEELEEENEEDFSEGSFCIEEGEDPNDPRWTTVKAE